MPRVDKVIEMAAHRGAGVFPDPHRIVMQYWTLDGETLLAERDEWAEQEAAKPQVKREGEA